MRLVSKDALEQLGGGCTFPFRGHGQRVAEFVDGEAHGGRIAGPGDRWTRRAHVLGAAQARQSPKSVSQSNTYKPWERYYASTTYESVSR